MSQEPSVKLKPTVWDAVVAAVVVALAIGIAVAFYGGQSGGALTAEITHRGERVKTVRLSDLTESQTVTVDGVYHLTILLEGDGVTVTEADCPTQDCVHTGKITRAGQSIVCLPEQVTVRLTGASDGGPDVVIG
jgi:hypothetical protein